MQVEYEETPTTFSTSEILPPQIDAEEGQSDEEEQDDEPEEEEEDEDEQHGEEAQAEPGVKTKTKRIIKQRQSLSEKQTGTTIFPISRVKKICKADKDLDMMTSEATFMVSVATEYFIKHFMEEGCTKARLDKRKLVTYKDMANVVARSEEFDFLKDVIPLPIPMSEALRARQEKQAAEDNPMEDDEGSGPLDMTGSDILPPLAHSTNPLFPNAIVKKPPNNHSKAGPKAGKATSDEKKEEKEAKKAAAAANAVPPPPPKPYVGKNGPTTATGLTTRSRRSLAASDAGAEMAEARGVVGTGEEVPEEATIMTADDDRMDQD